MEKERMIQVGDDEVVRYLAQGPYRTVFRNNDTRALDEAFGLDGTPIEEGSELDDILRFSTETNALGQIEVEDVLKHFADMARQQGYFLGLPGQQLLDRMAEGKVDAHPRDVAKALRYQDPMQDGRTYLKALNVEDVIVLFPMNLVKRTEVYDRMNNL